MMNATKEKKVFVVFVGTKKKANEKKGQKGGKKRT